MNKYTVTHKAGTNPTHRQEVDTQIKDLNTTQTQNYSILHTTKMNTDAQKEIHKHKDTQT